ncbi:MAG TPA: hypothetical protein VF314_14330 [Actinomycetes bacterium]
MNLISKATSAVIHPVQTVTSLAGQTAGLAAAAARTTMRIIDRAAGQVHRDSSDVWSATDAVATPADPGTVATPEATLVEPAARKAPNDVRTPSGVPAADEG